MKTTINVTYRRIFLKRVITLQLLQNMAKLIDMLEDSDDVQNEYRNSDLNCQKAAEDSRINDPYIFQFGLTTSPEHY